MVYNMNIVNTKFYKSTIKNFEYELLLILWVAKYYSCLPISVKIIF